jgi:hypothetical protein
VTCQLSTTYPELTANTILMDPLADLILIALTLLLVMHQLQDLVLPLALELDQARDRCPLLCKMMILNQKLVLSVSQVVNSCVLKTYAGSAV